MNKRNYRKLGAALLVVGLVGGAVTAFTLAGFTAQTRNPANVFASGTLVLSNKVASGTTCYSSTAGNTDTNVNNACDTMFNLSVQKPGDSASANLTLKNEGSINATNLKSYMNSCATTNTAESYHGTGDMCTQVLLNIQAYSDAAFTTTSTCVYGAATSGVCNFTDTAKNLSNFASTYGSGSPLDLSTMNAGTSRYYKINISFPSTSGNTFQGRQATFDFTWTLNQ